MAPAKDPDQLQEACGIVEEAALAVGRRLAAEAPGAIEHRQQGEADAGRLSRRR